MRTEIGKLLSTSSRRIFGRTSRVIHVQNPRQLHRRPAMRIAYLSVACSAVLGAGVTYDRYPQMADLTGQFDITGRTAVDPPPEEGRDTHFRVYLTETAAKDLYERMNVPTSTERCGNAEGRTVKTIGDMTCIKTIDSRYECWFAIDIANQEINGGWSC